MDKEKDKPLTQTVHVLVTGRVQGVGFRAWTERTAAVLDVNGWVRNRRDGSVEALFAGDATRVSEMVRRCHEGPRAAIVDKVAVTEKEVEEAAGFNVLPTA
jgi:acylphosphatase